MPCPRTSSCRAGQTILPGDIVYLNTRLSAIGLLLGATNSRTAGSEPQRPVRRSHPSRHPRAGNTRRTRRRSRFLPEAAKKRVNVTSHVARAIGPRLGGFRALKKGVTSALGETSCAIAYRGYTTILRPVCRCCLVVDTADSTASRTRSHRLA